MGEPIRILCVFATLDRGGSETLCMNYYRRMDRSKVQFDFVKHTHEVGSYEEEILELGGRIYEAPRYRFFNELAYRRWWLNHLKHHPEHQIIHGHYFTIAGVFLIPVKQCGRVAICHSHSAGGTSRSLRALPEFAVLKLLYGNAARLSDYRFACGSAAGERVFGRKSFAVLKNAIETEKYRFNDGIRQRIRSELFPAGSFVFGTVGSFSAPKNPLRIVRIVQAVCAIEPRARFLWVGDGIMRPRVEAAIAARGLADKVVLTGTRADVHELLQAMDVFILPSLFEGLPMVMVEAQAAGLPCVISAAVPADCDFAGSAIRRVSFDECDEVWAAEILDSAFTTERSAGVEIVRSAGFDIGNEARRLQDFYLRAAAKDGQNREVLF